MQYKDDIMFSLIKNYDFNNLLSRGSMTYLTWMQNDVNWWIDFTSGIWGQYEPPRGYAYLTIGTKVWRVIYGRDLLRGQLPLMYCRTLGIWADTAVWQVCSGSMAGQLQQYV